MALKDMTLTAAEVKDQSYGCCYPEGEEDDGRPKYPYGLELCVRQEAMKKLGLGLMPVGTEVMVIAKATVTGTSSRQSLNGEGYQDMDVQITHMEIAPVQVDTFAAAARTLYGGD